MAVVVLTVSLRASEPTSIIPVSTQPPGGLLPENTPQLILITFDDAVNSVNYDDILKITDHQNADGSPIAMTFYISVDYTDYYLLHKLHAAGHEIAVHTMTHTTGNETDFDTWIREIEGCRESLVRYAGIPREQITGFRSPYLAYNEHTWKALSLLGFSYDSSVPEISPGLNSPDEANYIWPYTLHDGLKQRLSSGSPPTENFPDLMEIPMWTLITGDTFHNMDPEEPSEAAMLAMLKNNFTTRYEGNRVPVGIYFHSGWLTADANTNAMNDFLEWALAKPDVYVVGVGALAKWMRNPVSAETAAAEGIFQVNTYTPVPESDVITNSFGSYGFRSVINSASVYPAPDTAFLKRGIIDAPVSFRIEVTSKWDNGYQANIIATNTGGTTYTGWKMEMDLGDSSISSFWGPANQEVENDKLTLTPNGYDSEIIPGEDTIASFVATGNPETAGAPDSTIWDVVAEAPHLSMGADVTGPLLQWNRVAPVYELQGLSSLDSGDWQTIKTLYGAEETPVEAESSYLFYRLHCIH